MRKHAHPTNTHQHAHGYRLSDLAHVQEEELRQWNHLACLAQQARTLEQIIWRNLNLVRDEGRMSSEALFEQVLT
jgi:hypothetical protein